MRDKQTQAHPPTHPHRIHPAVAANGACWRHQAVSVSRAPDTKDTAEPGGDGRTHPRQDEQQ
jgi:hypothetical protein